MSAERVTYKQLDELLIHLGFSRAQVSPRWLRYEHAPSETLIVVPEKKPNELVRITDVVSARCHLIEKGIITEENLNSILSQNSESPVASGKNSGSRGA